jgi:uncharacterized RDD family membrane protein YckC
MTAAVPRAYAGPVSRTLAYGIDAVTVAAVFTVAAVIMGLIASVVGTEARDLVRAAVSAYLVLLPATFAVYNAVFWLLAGRTPGMALLGLRVVTARGRPVSWLAALVRAVVLGYFPVGALWSLVDRRHQALHDKLARTVVVRAPAPAPALTRSGPAGGEGEPA